MLFPSIQAITLEKRHATLVLFHLIWALGFLRHSACHSLSTPPKHTTFCSTGRKELMRGAGGGWGVSIKSKKIHSLKILTSGRVTIFTNVKVNAED